MPRLQPPMHDRQRVTSSYPATMMGRYVRTRLTVLLIVTMFGGSEASSQTSGPTQPEFQSIAGAKALEFVNPFTGDLHYTVNLFDLPGPNGKFPFVLEYQSGFGPAQEASWVGLGWSLNPGVINRQMRGLPDDFKNERI